MLFILTGDIRSGKTTWLEARVRELGAAGVPVRGVLAPGVWHDGEKVGIENVLLPSCERVLLATPAGDGCSGGLGWDFDVAALARVNTRLAGLAATGKENARPGLAATGEEEARPGLLAIDEIGPLELRGGGGLTAALTLLDAGPRPAWPHALVIVRSALAGEVAARLRPTWGFVELIRPNGAGESRLREVILGGLLGHPRN